MIQRVEIENFKSIREASVELRPINILIGANGAGKSNFIGFFKLLNQLYQQNLQTYVIQNGRADNFLYFGRKQSKSLIGSIFFENKNKQVTNCYKFRLVPDVTNTLFLQEEQSGYNLNAEKDSLPEMWHNNAYVGESRVLLESTIKNSTAFRDKYLRDYLDGFRVYHFHDTSFAAPVKQFSRLHDNSFLREDGSNLAAFLYLLQEKAPSSFRLIEVTIKSVAPFFKSFDLAPSKLNEDQIELKWYETGSDMYLNAHNLSDGTLRMICLITLLLQPELPETIIIDEPELGLHPFAINKLAGLIKSAAQKGCQIILSTQSVGLIDNFEPEDIIVADREDKQSVFRRLNSDDLRDWLESYGLGELWIKNIIGGRP